MTQKEKDKMSFKKRNINCGEIRPENDGKDVVVNGWVASRRDLGGLIFFDIRDRWGITQVVIEPENTPDLAEKVKHIRSEYVIWASGKVRLRESPNKNMPTGLVEIVADEFEVISKAELPPFEITDDSDVSEELKLRYRYLDLRRHSLQKKFIVRNKLTQVVHKYFTDNDFLEIETPILMKSTPEGARDFLVPSRINKGKFYALPQSPQIFKQILMVSGFDKYVQITKCFRDEDLRSDRQPEFTQIDLEMSFIEQDDVINVTEAFVKQAWAEVLGIEMKDKFLQITYHEAMERFGSDKPDMRFDMEIVKLNEIIKNSEFKVFNDVINSNGTVACINAKGCASYSRKNLDDLTDFAKKYGAKGLAWIKLENGEVKSPIAKFMTEAELNGIIEAASAKDGDLILISSDSWKRSLTILGALRIEIAKREGIIAKVKDKFAFLWVVDFPLFEWDESDKRYYSMHHPFTSPHEDDIALLDTDPGAVRSRGYDIVCNGYELGGGSIRIHNIELQEMMFRHLGISEEEVENKFGFLIKAFKYGVPPHGGVALGLDRMTMLMTGTDNIRDVIAFPKTTSGLSLMDGSPSIVDNEQLAQLGLNLKVNHD